MARIAVLYYGMDREFGQTVTRSIVRADPESKVSGLEIESLANLGSPPEFDWIIIAVTRLLPGMEDTFIALDSMFDPLGFTLVTQSSDTPQFPGSVVRVRTGDTDISDRMADLLISIEESISDYKRLEQDFAINNNVLITHSDGSTSINPLLMRTVDDLEFSARTSRVIALENIVYLGDLVQKTEAEWLRTPGFGRKSLNEVKEVLSGIGLRLGLHVPGWPPNDIEAELDRLKLAERISSLQQEPFGATFKVEEEIVRIDPSGSSSDKSAAESTIVQQLHSEIIRKAANFAGLAPRLDNQVGWNGIGSLSKRLLELVHRPTHLIPDVVGSLYGSTLELASFLEMDGKISQGLSSFATPLDPEIRRPMEDVVRTLAPWLRSFPSIRELDEEMGKFLSREVHTTPALGALEKARRAELIIKDDAESIAGLLAADARGSTQGRKAGHRGFYSVRNLVFLAASLAGTFAVGAVSSNVSTRSVLVQRAGDFVISSERFILEMMEDLPHDVRLAFELLTRALEEKPIHLPRHPSQVKGAGKRQD